MTLCHWSQLSKKYGSVFTVYMGPKKVVVLAGYKTVKEALINHAEVFGDRDPMQIVEDTHKGHGKERLSNTYLFMFLVFAHNHLIWFNIFC